MKKVFLAILLAAAVLFGAAYGLNGIAAKNAQNYHLQLMKTLLPGSESFTVEPYSGEDGNIRSVHKSDIGFVVETVTYGYADEITIELFQILKDDAVKVPHSIYQQIWKTQQ